MAASIENLVYSLEYAHAIKDIEELHVYSNDQRDKLPIVETYINICNAYLFQGQQEQALDYAEGGISMA